MEEPTSFILLEIMEIGSPKYLHELLNSARARENFSFLAERGIEPAIKVRKNSSGRARGCHERKRVALEYLRDPKAWKRRVSYGLRWMA